MRTVQDYLIDIGFFIKDLVVPLIFAIALLFFLWNAARYFVIEGNNAAGREKARQLALYGIGAFVIMVSIWGVVNLLISGLDIGQNVSVCPDYIEEGSAGCGTPSPNSKSNNYGWTNNPEGEFGGTPTTHP